MNKKTKKYYLHFRVTSFKIITTCVVSFYSHICLPTPHKDTENSDCNGTRTHTYLVHKRTLKIYPNWQFG